MPANRRSESLLRLETLGSLSECYDHVTKAASESGTVEDDDGHESQWEVDSDASKASTVAVVFDKAAPPGVKQPQPRSQPQGQRRASESAWSDDSEDELCINASKLRPTKGQRRLPRPGSAAYGEQGEAMRHPSVLRPGLRDSAKVQSPVKTNSFIPPTPAYAQPRQDLRASYAAYHPEQSVVPVQTRASASGIRHTGSSFVDRYVNTSTPSTPNSVSDIQRPGSSFAHRYARVSTPSMGSPSHAENRYSSQYHVQAQPSPPSPEPVLNQVYGSDFELLGPPTPPAHYPAVPPPVQQYHAVQPAAQHHAARSIPAIYSGHPEPRRNAPPVELPGHYEVRASMNNSPAQPNKKRGSFIERAQEHMRASVHEHMVKAGLRPNDLPYAPKSHTPTSRSRTPSRPASTTPRSRPIPTAPHSRPETINTPPPHQDRGRIVRANAAPPEERGRGQFRSVSTSRAPSRSPSPAYGSWVDDHPRQKRASFADRAHEHWDRWEDEHLIKAGRRPNHTFHVDSVAKNPYPQGHDGLITVQDREEREFQAWRKEHAKELHPPVHGSIDQFRHSSPVQSVVDWRSTPANGPRNEESLFFDGNSSARNPAGYSFFSSEYVQRQIASQSSQPQVNRLAPPRAQSASGFREAVELEGSRPDVTPRPMSVASFRDTEPVPSPGSLPRAQTTTALSKEALGLGQLPSPLEDLKRAATPGPLEVPKRDDRAALPSQVRAQEQYVQQQKSVPSRSLARKRGMQLR
ncbi:hypothetical protein F5Y18DRAFT_351409 [Xylariaceae sp. FL1019]|nr:hypothetical protein F5Y18DRAFT_351409 [Xylariaceae sp. FL1019]